MTFTRNRMLLAVGILLFLTLLATAIRLPSLRVTTDSVVAERVESVGAAPVILNGDVSSIASRLADGSKPFVIGVLGDATGNEQNEWVYLIAERISKAFARPVNVHNWLMGSDYYSSQTLVGAPDLNAAPVDIWNGSASGESSDYSNAFFNKLVPVRPDLVFVSHAHNALSVTAQQNGLARLNQNVDQWRDTAPVVVYILQNPRSDSRAELQQQLVETAQLVAARVGAATVDVNGAFGQDYANLLRPDGFNPNEAGQRIWANAVEQKIGIGST